MDLVPLQLQHLPERGIESEIAAAIHPQRLFGDCGLEVNLPRALLAAAIVPILGGVPEEFLPQ